MQLILQQTFPLGRFHATTWKVFPYDDPHSEWPPSPWRLVRAVLARSYQLDREIADSTEAHAELREALVRAFATSQVEWQLPSSSWRGPGLRQYQPVEFDWGYGQPTKKTLITLSDDLASSLGGAYGLQEKGEPDLVEIFDSTLCSIGFRRVTPEQLGELKKLEEAQNKPNAPKPRKLKRYPPDARTYGTSKVLDNFWVTSNGTSAPVLWHFDGPDWTPLLLAHLDACLARMTYFGRAESITEIRRIEATALLDEPVKLSPRRSGQSVPVLALQPDATLAQLEATTDAPSVKDTNIPPGSRWMYAERPPRPQVRPAKRPMPELPPTSLIQFAIGSTVTPRYKDTVRITERFRAKVLGSFTKLLTGNAKMKWADAPPDVSEKAFMLSGRQPDGTAAKGHNHASFFLCGEESSPSRLCVWRREPFTPEEQRAILDAASSPLPLNYDSDSWTITLVPLDKLVPPPPGLDGKPSHVWKTLTPYVPARHVHDRKGRVKEECSVETQITEELAERANAILLSITPKDGGWVKVHQKMSKGTGQTNSDKRGYHITLTFEESVCGPITLGSSSHFGLGLFVPAD